MKTPLLACNNMRMHIAHIYGVNYIRNNESHEIGMKYMESIV